MALEFTPPEAPAWLGESRQATQVDAAFVVRRNGDPVGYLLIEVKLGERSFGACRGAKKPNTSSAGNPRPDRCRSFAQVLGDPERECWLAQTEGRTYWRHLRDAAGPVRFDRLPDDAPCPFSGGVYQLMRNRVLAHALVRDGGAEWADFALCTHPGNDAVDALDEPVRHLERPGRIRIAPSVGRGADRASAGGHHRSHARRRPRSRLVGRMGAPPLSNLIGRAFPRCLRPAIARTSPYPGADTDSQGRMDHLNKG